MAACSENLEAEIFVVSQSDGLSPENISGDAIPAAINRVGGALVGFKALLFHAGAPAGIKLGTGIAGKSG